jgi:hypothetical protein
MSLAIITAGFVRSAAPMAAVFLLLGVANSAINVSINSLYYKDGSEPDSNRKYGRFVGWLSLGPPTGLLLGSVLVRLAGFQMLLWAMAGLAALAALAARGLGGEKFAAVAVRDYRFSVFNKRTLLFSAFLVLLALHWGTELTVYGPFLRTRFGLSDSGVALFMAGAYLALSFSAFLVGRLRDDPARNRRLLLLGMTLSGLGLILMTVGDIRLVPLPLPPRGRGWAYGRVRRPDHLEALRKEDHRGKRGHPDDPPDLGPYGRQPDIPLAGVPGRASGADDRRRLSCSERRLGLYAVPRE